MDYTQNTRLRLLCVGRDLRGGGAERVQLQLLQHLDRAAFTFKVFYLNDSGVLHSLIPGDATPVFATHGQVNLKAHAFSIIWRLLRHIASCDVVFAMQEGTPSYLAIVAAELMRKPVVAWKHNVWPNPPGSAKWTKLATALLYPLVARFIGVSRQVGEHLVAETLVKADQVVTLPNPMPLSELRRMSEEPLPAWAEEVFRRPTILAVARLDRTKRLDLLLRAFHGLVSQGTKANLLILGEGPLRAELQALAADLGLSGAVFMPGFELNPYRFFGDSRFLVLTSESEGLSMVLIEALCLGLPAIAFDCPGGPREILQGGRFGILVPPGNVAALKSAMTDVLNNQDLRTHFSNEGVRRAEAFDAPAATRLFEAEFRRAADAG